MVDLADAVYVAALRVITPGAASTATGATAATEPTTGDVKGKDAKLLEQFGACPICYEVFQEPKVLTCLHRFCASCLQQYLSALDKKQLSKDKGFKCPLCKELILSPDPKKALAEWPDLFKTDFHLKNLIAFVQSSVYPEENGTTAFCKGQCKHKTRDLYCVDCVEVVCGACVEEYHKECNLVMDLQDAAADLKASANLWLADVIPKLEEAATLDDLREQNLDQLSAEVSNVRETIQQQSEDLHRLIKDAEHKLLEQLDRWYESEQNKIALETITFNDTLVRYKEHQAAVLSCMKCKLPFDLMTHNSMPLSLDEFPPKEINTKRYNQFVQRLGRMKICYQKAAAPPINLGKIKITAPTY